METHEQELSKQSEQSDNQQHIDDSTDATSLHAEEDVQEGEEASPIQADTQDSSVGAVQADVQKDMHDEEVQPVQPAHTSVDNGHKFNSLEKVYKAQENNNRYSHPRNNGGSERRGEFYTDRDGIRTSKFKKFDKIEAKKLVIDYKKPEILQEFLTEKGRILSRLITGNSAQNQRKLTREVKRARYIGFLPNA